MARMSYTRIPLEKLDAARAMTHEKLRDFEKITGRKFMIRTFYVGPRPITSRNHNPATTRKENAVCAKIAIYERKNNWRMSASDWPSLLVYV